MKVAIAQSGPEDAGKSTTIRTTYSMFRDRYPNATFDGVLDNGKDIRAIVTIGDIKIGIESQGDPWKKATRLDPSLELFVRLRCDIIICATRTFGGTRESFLALKDEGYRTILRPRTREVGRNAQYKRNLEEAEWMLEQIESACSSAVA